MRAMKACAALHGSAQNSFTLYLELLLLCLHVPTFLRWQNMTTVFGDGNKQHDLGTRWKVETKPVFFATDI